MTFSAFQTSSISTRADFRRRARLREFIEIRLAYESGAVIGLCSLACTACQYDVPITSHATRKVQEQLLGDWTSSDGKEKLKLRSFDDSVYLVYYDGDLFRAYHSDVAETSFATLQDLNSSDRKYAYVVWKVLDDGRHLSLRSVSDK